MDPLQEQMLQTLTKEEFADMQDLSVLMNAQREHQLMTVQAELAAAKIEIIRLKLKIKYNLDDADTINSTNGLITRSAK